MQLRRFISTTVPCSRQKAHRLVATGEVLVEGQLQRDPDFEVSKFHLIVVAGKILQQQQSRYLMLHKPKAVVSSTCHGRHQTVIDLIDEPFKYELHLAGRLDFNSTGLMLLTNDGKWSRFKEQPQHRQAKVYEVLTEQVIDKKAVTVFAKGIYFHYENYTTAPAELEIVSPKFARLTLYDGKYHQVKRMFGYFNNKVLQLHRVSIAHIILDADLQPGQYRHLTADEIKFEK